MPKRVRYEHVPLDGANPLMKQAHRVYAVTSKKKGERMLISPDMLDLSDPLTQSVFREMRESKKGKRKPDFDKILSAYRGRAKSETFREVMAIKSCLERYPELLQSRVPA